MAPMFESYSIRIAGITDAPAGPPLLPVPSGIPAPPTLPFRTQAVESIVSQEFVFFSFFRHTIVPRYSRSY